MEERIFNDFDTTRKLSFSTHVLFLWREFNLHARSRASNIHHCWRESKIKGRNRRKQGSNQRTFFIHVRTRRELIFSSTSFSVSNTSPRVFALHCFACYSKRRKIFNAETLLSLAEKMITTINTRFFHWFIPSSDHPFSFRIIEYHVP